MSERYSMKIREKPQMILRGTKERRSLTPRMRRRAKRVRQKIIVIAFAVLLLITFATGILVWQLNVSTNETKAATQDNAVMKQFSVELDRVINTSTRDEELRPVDIVAQGKIGYLIDPFANTLCSFNYDEKTVRKLNLSSRLDKPLAVDVYKGNVYIADSNAARVAIVSHGRVSGLAVSTGNTLAQPSGIKVLDNGDVLISDAANHRVIQICPDGGVTRIIGTGLKDGTNKGLDTPSGITVDNKDNIYVCDSLNSRVQKFSAEGRYVATYGKLGGTKTKLSRPVSVAVDNKGHIYVADSKKNMILVFSQDDKLLGLIGNPLIERDRASDAFDELAGIKVFEDRLFVADHKGKIYIFKLPSQFRN